MASGISVGSLYASLELDRSHFEAGVKSSQGLFGSLASVAKASALAIGAALLAAGAAAVKMATDYKAGVDEIRAGTGATGKALDALEGLGVELVHIDLPELNYNVLFGILTTEAAAAFEEITLTDSDDTMKWQEARAWPNTFRTQWFYPAIEFVQAERLRRRIAGMMDLTMDGLDAIFAPSFAASLLLITNFTGHPQLCLRAGFRDDGTPKGVSLWGHHFDEGTICRIGAALEAELAVADVRPTL